MSWTLRREARGWVCRGPRPGAGWHAHGYTIKRLRMLHETRLVVVEVHKQRWLEVATGRTMHDRPGRDVSWSHFGLAAVFAATWAWMTSPRGLHHVAWPWLDESPCRRTAQRWLSRLFPDALAWQVAMRDVAVERLAPTPLERVFPAGLPPPRTMARWRSSPAQACQLHRGIDLLRKCAPMVSKPWSRLVVEAKARFDDNNRQP